jgi:hypothetical protein
MELWCRYMVNAMKNRIDDYGIIDIGNDGDETPVKGIDDIEELKSFSAKVIYFPSIPVRWVIGI